MQTLSTIGQRIADRMKEGGFRNTAASPLTDLLKEIFALLSSCFLSPAQARERSERVVAKKGFGWRFDRRTLHRLIRKNHRDEDADDIEAACCDELERISDTEFASCMDEAKTS